LSLKKVIQNFGCANEKDKTTKRKETTEKTLCTLSLLMSSINVFLFVVSSSTLAFNPAFSAT